MASKRLYSQFDEQPPLPKEVLPTMYDLPDEGEDQPGMPDIFHVWQTRLLDETFRPPNYEPEEIFAASDLNIYYNVHDFSQCKRPDWFAVVGLQKLGNKPEMRLSYLIWQEGIAPQIVVELLSPSTEKEDLGLKLRDAKGPPSKWEVYERWLRVPYYVTFSRYNDELRVFKLSGPYYQEVTDHQGRLWVEGVELGLGLWQGKYLNEERLWLRWYDREGNWIPTADEIAEQERQRADTERREKEAALQKAAQLADKLRELGIDPDHV
jgi:Uma2 family endonuclease